MKPYVVALLAFGGLALVGSANVAPGAEAARVEVDVPRSPLLVGEPILIDVTVTSLLGVPIQVPKLGVGLTTGAVSIEVTEPAGTTLPRVPVQYRESEPGDLTTLKPGEKLGLEDCNVGWTPIDPKPGQYLVKVRVGTSAGLVEGRRHVLMVAGADAKVIHEAKVIRLGGAEWADRGEVGHVEAIRLGDRVWAFYRRIRPNGSVKVVVRLGQLTSGDNEGVPLIATGDEKRIDVAYVRQRGGIELIRLDTRDGSLIP